MTVHIFLGVNAQMKALGFLTDHPQAVVVTVKDKLVQMATMLGVESTGVLSEDLIEKIDTHPAVFMIEHRQPSDVIVYDVPDEATLKILTKTFSPKLYGDTPPDFNTLLTSSTPNLARVVQFVTLAAKYFPQRYYDNLCLYGLGHLRHLELYNHITQKEKLEQAEKKIADLTTQLKNIINKSNKHSN